MSGAASEGRVLRARQRGDVPVSRRLLRAVGLAAALVGWPLCAKRLWGSCEALLSKAIELAAQPHPDTHAPLGKGATAILFESLLGCLFPLVGALALGAVVAALLQGGGRWAKERKPARPAESWVGAGLGALAFMLVALASVRLLADSLPALLQTLDSEQLASRSSARRSLGHILDLGGAQATQLLVLTTALALAVGILDIVLERIAWRRRHSISPGEERRERRAREVAPEVRTARQRAHRRVVNSGLRSTSETGAKGATR